jgi:hypothetical protein
MSYQPLLVEIDLAGACEQVRGADASRLDELAAQLVSRHEDLEDLLEEEPEHVLRQQARTVLDVLAANIRGERTDAMRERDWQEEQPESFGDIAALVQLFADRSRIVAAPVSVRWFERDVMPLLDRIMPGFCEAICHLPFEIEHMSMPVQMIDAAACARLAADVRLVELDDSDLYDYVLPFVASVEEAAETGRDLLWCWL